MKYKVGDRVRIKNIDWYNRNKDRIDEVTCGNTKFIPAMVKYCEGIVTISFVLPTLEVYHIKEDDDMFNWTDEMIEGLAEEETKPNIIEEVKTYWDSIKDAWICPDGYIFKDENGNVINATKIVLEKKKKEYPKTYEECCKILGLNSEITDSELLFYYPLKCGDYTTIRLPEMEKFEKFIQLYLCRNAYWKIAGEEMGLGKPWKPDWNTSEPKYVIACTSNGIEKQWETTYRKCFAFPTEEMRDAFKENFDPDIEICKELL